MSGLTQWWNNLPSEVRYGVLATIYGGIALAVIGTLWKFSGKLAVGFARLIQRILNRSLPPDENNKAISEKKEDKITETPRPLIADPLPPPPALIETSQPKIPAPSSDTPRDLAVEFVPRRDKEGHDILSQLKEKLAPDRHRLVALWGAGGVGKTRLAIEAAHSLSEAFVKRIIWVSADGRPDFTLSTLLDGIATQFQRADVRQLAPEPKEEAVRDIIAAAPTLVVLDNFETIAEDEQARCREFLARRTPCPALITTRQRIASNFVDNISIDAMSPDEAQKFLEQLIAPSPDPEVFDTPTRARIIQTAAAIPLVMEWVVQRIILFQEPQSVLDSLAQGDSDVARRVFNSSFNLPQVGADGRDALLALSLFTPSASRVALAEVAGFGNDTERLNRAIASLGALRLARMTEGGKRLLVEGLTRDLAGAHLSSSPRAADFRQRFIACFMSYAEAHAQPTPEDFDALELDKDNLLSAMDMAFDSKDWKSVFDIGCILFNPVRGMLSVRGYWDEAIKRGEQAMAAAREVKQELAIAQCAGNIASIRMNRGEYDEARKAYQEALATFKKSGSDKNVAAALHLLGMLAQAQGELKEARRLYNESLEIEKRLGNQNGIAISLHQLGRLAEAQGETEEVRRLYNESLEIEKRLGDQSGTAISLHALANLALSQGNFVEARQLYEESLKITKRLGDKSNIGLISYNMSLFAEQEGNKEEAVNLMREALSIFEKLKSSYAEMARRELERLEGKSS